MTVAVTLTASPNTLVGGTLVTAVVVATLGCAVFENSDVSLTKQFANTMHFAIASHPSRPARS